MKILGAAAPSLVLLLSTGCTFLAPPQEPSGGLPGYLFTITRDGLVRISATGDTSLLAELSAADIEVKGGSIYLWVGGIMTVDPNGEVVQRVDVPESVSGGHFTVLDDGFAIFDNGNDVVYLLNSSGELEATVPILPEPDSRWQVMDGVVVGNRVIISEDGRKHLVALDLDTLEVSVFRDLSALLESWLGAITYVDGRFYLCGPQRIYSFAEGGEIAPVAEVPGYNISGITVAGGRIYVSTNHTGAIYRVDPETGEVVEFASGLNYPKGIAFLPASQ